MSWNKMPYWLRGGLIGLIISTVVGALSMIFQVINVLPLLSKITEWLQLVVYAIPLSILGSWRWSFLHYCSYLPSELCPPNLITFIINGIIVFIIGALVGWIYGKIKNQKRGKK